MAALQPCAAPRLPNKAYLVSKDVVKICIVTNTYTNPMVAAMSNPDHASWTLDHLPDKHVRAPIHTPAMTRTVRSTHNTPKFSKIW